MNHCPKIGTRVRFSGNSVTGACVGVVVDIYPTYVWDEIRDLPTHDTEPESEWHVALKPTVIPTPWPYTGYDKFAPQVSELSE
jgi:hypothetical protein